MSTNEIETIDLGTMNFWFAHVPVRFPAEYTAHVNNPACKGQEFSVNIGCCVTRSTCRNCGITYLVDSTD